MKPNISWDLSPQLSSPVLTISGECMEPKYNRQKRCRVIHLYWPSTVHYSPPGTVILLPISHFLAPVKKYIHVGRFTHMCAYIHKHVSTTLCGFTHMYVYLPWYCEYVHTYTYTHHNRVNAAFLESHHKPLSFTTGVRLQRWRKGRRGKFWVTGKDRTEVKLK